ncbi:hypothetical protein GQ53DRAFT_764454 [Thozetella sp. PMI_491]|nr:hypothetical protein GQ53DRAFT_764454 [Thozetella sp. PMI_491]
MANNVPPESFLLFPRLPIEIQRWIWEFCLPAPARVVEIDAPCPKSVAGTSCELQRTSQLNSRPPLVSLVCHEARSVGLLRHRRLYTNLDAYDGQKPGIDTQIRDPWVREGVDVLHINWGPGHGVIRTTNPPASPLRFYLWLARQRRIRVSFMSTLFMGFDQSDAEAYFAGAFDVFKLLSEDGGPYQVTLRMISLHIPSELALRSGLFGRLCEERVQLVASSDKAGLQAYRDLWAAGPVADQEPAEFFDLAIRRHEDEWLKRVAGWKRRVETKWVLACLYMAQRMGLPGIQAIGNMSIIVPEDVDLNPEEVGAPGTTETILGVNKEHPWVIETLRKMPRFEPTVMFRLCDSNCHEAHAK